MGNTFGYFQNRGHDDHRQATLDRVKLQDLRSEGDFAEWKIHTELVFESCGMARILTDGDYAAQNKTLNNRVYAMLALHTLKGPGSHRVRRHSVAKDGHQAWQDLLTFFQADGFSSQRADGLRRKITSLFLHSGGNLADYINKFETWNRQLDAIDGEGLTASHKLQTFLDNIKDPMYVTQIEIIRTNRYNLNRSMHNLREAEAQYRRNASSKRTWNNTIRRVMDDHNEELSTPFVTPPSSKRRRLNHISERRNEQGFLHADDPNLDPTIDQPDHTLDHTFDPHIDQPLDLTTDQPLDSTLISP